MPQNPITGREEISPSESGVGVLRRSGKQVIVAEYNFHLMGTPKVGFVPLLLPSEIIPKDAVITNSYVDIIEALVGGGTGLGSLTVLALSPSSASIITVLGPQVDPFWATTGRKSADTIEPGVESSYLKASSPQHIYFAKFGSVPFTAGRFKVVIEYDMMGN